MNSLATKHRNQPVLDPDFIPAVSWNRAYQDRVEKHPQFRSVQIALRRPGGGASQFATRMLPHEKEYAELNWRYGERLIKMLLWAWGGNQVVIDGAPELVRRLQTHYTAAGERAFDYDYMGAKFFGAPFSVESGRVPIEPTGGGATAVRQLDGCRIGFDLGGSDRKCAAVIDGEVVFSEEIKWSPYFETDPQYHIAGVRHSIELAAKHLPRVDCIGGSAAGVYIDNEARAASLFRGVSPEDFDRHIRGMFLEIQREWNVPMVVANDGDVTALAGALSLNQNQVLGISMGTSMAAGYVDASGQVTGWLNELAFAPIDYRANAPADEWSHDLGCGVQYFSQQAVARLIPRSGLDISGDLPLPEQLEIVQEKAARGDERALDIYRTIGVYFGYALAHYSEFYDFRHLLVLGRVTSGQGGGIVVEKAQAVLAEEFPELGNSISMIMPDEKMKRHGQAIAAAALPSIIKKQ